MQRKRKGRRRMRRPRGRRGAEVQSTTRLPSPFWEWGGWECLAGGEGAGMWVVGDDAVE